MARETLFSGVARFVFFYCIALRNPAAQPSNDKKPGHPLAKIHN